jgi:hypothetical protein
MICEDMHIQMCRKHLKVQFFNVVSIQACQHVKYERNVLLLDNTVQDLTENNRLLHKSVHSFMTLLNLESKILCKIQDLILNCVIYTFSTGYNISKF